MTSVPLPRATLSFGGCPLREIYPMAPLARGQSLAVGLTTYGGQVHVGLVADGKALPDLDGLAKNMTAELHALLRTTPGEPATGVEGALGCRARGLCRGARRSRRCLLGARALRRLRRGPSARSPYNSR